MRFLNYICETIVLILIQGVNCVMSKNSQNDAKEKFSGDDLESKRLCGQVFNLLYFRAN